MPINKEALELRKKVAEHRPIFVRQESGDIQNLQKHGENPKAWIIIKENRRKDGQL